MTAKVMVRDFMKLGREVLARLQLQPSVSRV